MRRLAIAVGLSLVAASCAPGAPSAQSTSTVTAAPAGPAAAGPAALLGQARRFVFRVRNPACLSTGTAFAYAGTVVTNRHVAAGATTLQLSTWSGTDFNASVGGHSGPFDLARLTARPPAGTLPPAAGPATPAVGSQVYVAGYPDGNQLTVTAGKVTGLTGAGVLGVSGPVLELSDTVKPGNSGSPLLDPSGRVVGVVFAYDPSRSQGLAMPLASLQSFLHGRPRHATLACTA